MTRSVTKFGSAHVALMTVAAALAPVIWPRPMSPTDGWYRGIPYRSLVRIFSLSGSWRRPPRVGEGSTEGHGLLSGEEGLILVQDHRQVTGRDGVETPF